MKDTLSFVLTFLLTNGFAGACAAACLLKWNERMGLHRSMITVIGFGLGPMFVSLVLYYGMLLLPGIGTRSLLILVLVMLLGSALYARSGWAVLLACVRIGFRPGSDLTKWFFLLGCVAAFAFMFYMLYNKPLVDHDVLEYAVQGRIFLEERAIHYSAHRFDVASGFYYVGLHGFGFPLLFSWEGALAGELGDAAWVRSLTVTYALFLITLLWVTLRRSDRWLAVYGTLSLVLSLGFAFLLFIFHLDSLRIFLFSASVWVLVEAMREPHPRAMLLMGLLAGLHAFIHSLGVILFFPMLLVWLIGGQGRPVDRWRGAVGAGCVFLITGGVHYVLDIVFGTGWLFKDIQWF